MEYVYFDGNHGMSEDSYSTLEEAKKAAKDYVSEYGGEVSLYGLDGTEETIEDGTYFGFVH